MPQQQYIKEKLFEIDGHISKRFDIKKRLGKGAYGIVWKAVDRKTREIVAVKKIFDAFRNQTDAQRTFREIMFLQALKGHPNVIKLHSIHRAGNNSDIYLGFEYMETDLHNVIKKGILKDVHKRYIMYQLFKAIKYIHSGNVIHRDLKPSNILLDVMCRCKIADFGLARSITQITDGSIGGDTDPTLTDYVATRWYRAPEILIASKRYTKGIDMWSLGCILAEIVAGKPIFPGSSTVNQVEKIMATIPTPSQEDINMVCISGIGTSMIKNASSAPKVSLIGILGKEIPKDALSLINQLLVFNPIKRLTADETLKHHYVANFHDPDQEINLTRDIVIPFNDDVRLSVEDYRNKLYEIMSTHHGNRLIKPASRIKLELETSKKMKTTQKFTNSEPKITENVKSNHYVANIRSDSRVISKHSLQFHDSKCPRAANNHSKIPVKNSSNDKKRTITSKNNYPSCYNQTHGIITHSVLMELKAGIR